MLDAGLEHPRWLYVVLRDRRLNSNSNVGGRGREQEQSRAAMLEIDPGTGAAAVYASGLRNPNGLAWEPQSGRCGPS